MKSKAQTVAIVDAYSSGRFLAPEFHLHGVECIHIQSQQQIPPFYQRTFRPEQFRQNVIYDVKDFSGLISQLKQLNLISVIAGSEPGVELADRIREALHLFPNEMNVARARRNKYFMIEAVRSAGLNCADQLKATSVDDIMKWARNRFPIVVKPLESAGTEHVTICIDEVAVRKAFQQIYGQVNQLGLRNTEVLAQTFLEGKEFIVNTVSWNAQHYVTDIWYIHKEITSAGSRMYMYAELMDPTGPEQDALRTYVGRALDALGIQFGPAHNEVMLTKEGPALIETGARLDGVNIFGTEPKGHLLQTHQLEVAVRAITHPEEFKAICRKPYQIHRYGLLVDILSNVKGVVTSIRFLDEIRKLPSYWFERLQVEPGKQVVETIDMFTCPGIVWLAHPSRAVLFKDYARIKEFERRGFFDV